jgi:hypothetical protein
VLKLVDDFDWSWTGVVVRKTDARVPFDRAHLSEVFHWCVYFLAVVLQPRKVGKARFQSLPDPLRPWYLLWPALWRAGIAKAQPGQRPDVWLHFEDKTQSPPIEPPANGAQTWNFLAHDLSKSTVAKAFEQAFGYSLAIDPEQGQSSDGADTCVEKGEANGVHDGRIVTLPCRPVPGKVYQKLIDNRAPAGLMEDLRTPTFKGQPLLVFIKRRPEAARFSNDNSACLLARVEDVFSAEEIAAIGRFCTLLKLDWGGLDILRDARDGRIYIVDANRTDMGPPIALPLSDKLKATDILAQALAQDVESYTQQPMRDKDVDPAVAGVV